MSTKSTDLHMPLRYTFPPLSSFPKQKKVYVIGMSGLEEELRDEGITILGGTGSRG